METHNNQPKIRGRDGGGIGYEARPSGNEGGGVHSIVLGRTSWERGVEYYNIDVFNKYFFFLAGLKN